MQRFGVPWHFAISIAVAAALMAQVILVHEALIAKRIREQAPRGSTKEVSRRQAPPGRLRVWDTA